MTQDVGPPHSETGREGDSESESEGGDTAHIVEEHAAGGIVLSSQRRILLLRKTKHGAVHWVLPKGHIEPGESREQAALREIREESGLDRDTLPSGEESARLEIGRHIGAYRDLNISGDGRMRHKLVDLFLVRYHGDERALRTERMERGFDGGEWFEPREALDRLTKPGQCAVLERWIGSKESEA